MKQNYLLAFAPYYGMPHMGIYGNATDFGGMGIVWLFVTVLLKILFWLVIILVCVKLFRWFRGQSGCCKVFGGGALEILRERYAEGKISQKEYEERKKVLEKK